MIRNLHTYTRNALLITAIALGIATLVAMPVSARAFTQSEANCRSSRPVMSQGDTGTCVKLAQQLLDNKGVYNYSQGYTGNFMSATKSSVERLQNQNGLVEDGIIGRNTWRVLLDGATSTAPPATTATAASLPAKCRTTSKSICVVKGSESRARLYAVQNSTVVHSFDVRTGDGRGPSYVTTQGTFQVEPNRKHVQYTSKAYGSEMPYSMFYNRGQAIHYSASFANDGYAGSSHGCVNIGSLADAKWLFDWTPERTRVVVTR